MKEPTVIKELVIGLRSCVAYHSNEKTEPICSTLGYNEYPHIYLDHTIKEDEFDNALNTVITYFMQKRIERMAVDLNKRNKNLTPAKKMTLKEIEEKLGHKVEVVSEK